MKKILAFIAKIFVWIWDGIRSFISGDHISSLFFKRHFMATSLVVIGCLMMIAIRFQAMTASNKYDSKLQQLNVIQTEKQKQRSLYKTLTRESAMTVLVDSLKLGLSIPDVHPVELHVDLSD